MFVLYWCNTIIVTSVEVVLHDWFWVLHFADQQYRLWRATNTSNDDDPGGTQVGIALAA